jgi:hypothetical protein
MGGGRRGLARTSFRSRGPLTPLTFFRLSLFLPLVIPLGDIPPTISGAMVYLAVQYSGVGYALTIPLIWWYLGKCQQMRDFRRVVLMAPAALAVLAMVGGGLLFALGCGFGIWGRGMILCHEPSTILLLAMFLIIAVVSVAYLYALLIVVASVLAVWLRIVRPPEAA